MSLPTDILQPFLAASATGGVVVRRLVLGFSGGLDSTVLLHRLREPAARHGLPLQVVHVHHGLQAAAEDWVRHADAQCAAWQLPLTVCRVQVPAQASVEAAARRARHEAFAAVLQEGDVLLLAQHGSDQAETVLFRLLRGSGVSGLGAMPAMTQLPGTSFPLWRPLLGEPRAALLAYAQAHGLRWVEDTSNADTRLARNFLRHEILPRLATHWPGAEQTLMATARRMQEADALLSEMAADLLAEADDAGRLRCDVLCRLAPARQRLLLRHWLAVQGFVAPDEAMLQRMLDEVVTARADATPLLRWSGAELRRYRQWLYLLPPQSPLPADWSCVWAGAQPLRLPDGRQLRASELPAASYVLRYRAGGEVLRRTGRAPADLKNLLQAAGIPPWERAALPLLFRDGELRAVAGLPGHDEDDGIRFHLEPAGRS